MIYGVGQNAVFLVLPSTSNVKTLTLVLPGTFPEVTQTCTVQRGVELFDIEGGCTLLIDPYGGIRPIYLGS